mgnify:CR=1 FL=1
MANIIKKNGKIAIAGSSGIEPEGVGLGMVMGGEYPTGMYFSTVTMAIPLPGVPPTI